MDTIPVALGERSYDILVGHDCLGGLGSALRERGLITDVMVYTSPRIGGLYFEKLRGGLEEAGFARVGRHDIPDGEENKNLDEWRRAVEALAEFSPRPESVPLVVNLGGGVVGDMGGFAAATFRRGICYVQVPTTLLANVDSGVGGKTGVNSSGVKNLVGAFWQPRLVFSDVALLDTLDRREVRSGIAEVVKYGAVCDAGLFAFLEERIEDLVGLHREVVLRIVRDCYRIKAEVVHADERDDKGRRIVLNFGHTIGHAIEMAAAYRMTHGEAVSVGMVGAARIAVGLGICHADVLKRLTALLVRAGLPTSAASAGVEVDAVMSAMRHDKKFVSGVNRFVLPVGIGEWAEREGVPEALVRSTVEACVGAA